MSDTKDLKLLLERLRSEVGPLPPERPEDNLASRPALPEGEAPRREGPHRPYRLQEPRPEERENQSNPAWSENKETMLFGMLASLIASLGGILAGLDYLVLIGAVVFSLFSLVMFLALLRFSFSPRRRGVDTQGLAERVDALSKRVELLSARAVSGSVPHQAGAAGHDRELEQKVEELRVLVKSLSKAVGSGNK
ncbi:MAG TPA: hypothetical protein DEQ38_03890 [Elusimicrobia bacterium]|nr:MAG: hypothetical protein A2089_13040 [Elusimicrobia bacterium GWD2_63_28]HCC47246.1 hypothetical protein [Elusimicrobiota bacterium]